MAVKASVTITISKYRDTDSITRYYKLQASTAAAPAVPTTLTPSGWSTSEPTYTSGSTNTLYYTDRVVFSDGTFQYTDDGNGKAVKSSSYEAAKEAYNKAQAAQSTANATQENLDNLEIGGRNYVLDSAKEQILIIPENNHFNMKRMEISQVVRTLDPTYKTFIFSCDAYYEYDDDLDHNTSIQLYFRNISGDNKFNFLSTQKITKNWTRVYCKASFKDGTTVADADFMYFRVQSDAHGVIIHAKNFKAEKGDKNTDWTPAPEDIDENIETVSAYAQKVGNELLTTKGQLTAASTRIDSLQGIIENFVKDDNGMVTVTQTGSGMQIDMTQATNRINQLLTAIESAVTEGEANKLRTELLAAIQAVQSRTAYINATQDAQGRPVITLGATDSPFKVEITNEAINFIQNGQVIAYANGQKFYNLRTVVQQDVQIGIGPGFIWKTRDSGNMGLTWVPAQS